MSRIDDDRAERRAEEARLADRRQQERLKKERSAEASAFDRKLAEKGGQVASERTFRESVEKDRASREPAKTPEKPADKAMGGSSAKPSEKKPAPDARGADRQATQRGAERAAGHSAQSSAGALAGSLKAEPRAVEHKEGSSEHHEGGEAKGEESPKDAAKGAQGKRGGPVKRASDDDAGSGGKGEGGGGSKDNKAMPFRLPPAALMAPPPLARPKDAGGSRLGSIAKEIVDKIVSRVLVGTNAQGVPEFRLELKSSVLKGLSIKVSGGRGRKIRAVFSGSDRETLEALKESSSELVEALAARGLTLESLEFEDSAG